MPKPLSREEQETVIRGNAAESTWDIVTADPKFQRYLERRGWSGRTDRQFGDPYKGYVLPYAKVRISSRVSSRAVPKNPFGRNPQRSDGVS